MSAQPDIHRRRCLNTSSPFSSEDEACVRCLDACPCGAISLNPGLIPELHAMHCTSCMACISVCPVDAITHEDLDPLEIISEARTAVHNTVSTLTAACAAAADQKADIHIGCHAGWDPLLLSCLAAAGVRKLHLEGISDCAHCPALYGSQVMQKTEAAYAALNRGLGIQLEISRQEPERLVQNRPSAESIPERRRFFQDLLPSITRSAIVAAAQISSAVEQQLEKSAQHDEDETPELPVRLQLFLRALPRLQANFTPIAATPSMPLGAIQADARCTACNQCVEQCPTAALGIREFGLNRILEFRPGSCTGCQRCVSLCPEHALESLPGISLPALMTQRERPLVMVASQSGGKDCTKINIHDQGSQKPHAEAFDT